MLWIPTRKQRKEMARAKRRQRRRRIFRLALFLFIFFGGLGPASVPSAEALLVQVDQVTRPYQFESTFSHRRWC
jgi:hypothetical protein